jgi:hypothetical protein
VRRISNIDNLFNTFILFKNVHPENNLPPAARGALFEKTAPLDPLQKLFIKKQAEGFPKHLGQQPFNLYRQIPGDVTCMSALGKEAFIWPEGPSMAIDALHLTAGIIPLNSQEHL